MLHLVHYFILKIVNYAGIAQLVERCLAKAKVAGSSPVSRSKTSRLQQPFDTLQFKNDYKINFLIRYAKYMKSIMEEASSISKAIDQAWNRAGKPMEFTIKVLETPERNLFCLTTKSAKIALFFDDLKIMSKFARPIEKVTAPPKQEPVQQPTSQPSLQP